ncbi:MAG: phospholipase D family protein [Steroidobacteraceae bacterium]|jgi:putative cardiolipin synthase
MSLSILPANAACYARRSQALGLLCALLATISAALSSGCAGLPPGADHPRVASAALADPKETKLGRQFADSAEAHDAMSGFRILPVGVDGFLTRVQMIEAAERTLDLQYFIFRGDETGHLITEALVRAAARGVRVRVLVDDGDTRAGDERLLALDGQPSIEIRVFNPFAYRGHVELRRAMEFLFNGRRLNYRMHNKLMVLDNAVALIGGRNIGNQYFQMDPESQFADDDVFTAGPVVQQLSARFDEYWNSPLSIPAAALGAGTHSASAAAAPAKPLRGLDSKGIDYVAMLKSDEPYAGMISGRLPLVWANSRVVCDSPDKKDVENGARPGRLMAPQVSQAAALVQTELLIVTPYYLPAKHEIQLVEALRGRNARVAILTNSLESAPLLLAQAGYSGYRKPLLEDGAEIYEVRSLLGSMKGSGQTTRISRFGNYALHAKLFVFDHERIFIGSMNFDQRSKRLNTEMGLIIDSPDLAGQIVARFDAMTRPENAYVLSLHEAHSGTGRNIVWDTVEQGKPVEYTSEPARHWWQRLVVRLLALLPVGREL